MREASGPGLDRVEDEGKMVLSCGEGGGGGGGERERERENEVEDELCLMATNPFCFPLFGS